MWVSAGRQVHECKSLETRESLALSSVQLPCELPGKRRHLLAPLTDHPSEDLGTCSVGEGSAHEIRNPSHYDSHPIALESPTGLLRGTSGSSQE